MFSEMYSTLYLGKKVTWEIAKKDFCCSWKLIVHIWSQKLQQRRIAGAWTSMGCLWGEEETAQEAREDFETMLLLFSKRLSLAGVYYDRSPK